jgi:hypothetical protein
MLKKHIRAYKNIKRHKISFEKRKRFAVGGVLAF